MKNDFVRFLFGFIALICCSFLFGLVNVSAKSLIVGSFYNTNNHAGDFYSYFPTGPAYFYVQFGDNDANASSESELDYSGNIVTITICSDTKLKAGQLLLTGVSNSRGIISTQGYSFTPTDLTCSYFLNGSYTHFGYKSFISFKIDETRLDYETVARENVATITLYNQYLGFGAYAISADYLASTDLSTIETQANSSRVQIEYIDATNNKTDTTTCNNSHWYGKSLCWFSDLFTSIGNGFTNVVNWFINLFSSLGSWFVTLWDKFSALNTKIDTAVSNMVYALGEAISTLFFGTPTKPETDSVGNLISNFEDDDNGNISSVITAPLRMYNKIDDSCSPVTLTYMNKNISLPCGDTIFWGRSDVSSFRTVWNLLIFGSAIYLLIGKVFKVIEKIKDPTDDRVEVDRL